MGMSGTGAVDAGRRRQRRRRGVMSEINVTPMVDVMLVLLIIFMVSAPLLTIGVPIDLPQVQAKNLDQDLAPLSISLDRQGKIFLQETEIGVEELVPKLKAISDQRGGGDQRINFRGSQKIDYGTVMKILARIEDAGFHRVALRTEIEQGF
jgi:biopolymer transport protein TolR